MTVKRIVANIATDDIPAGEKFYKDLLGLEHLMDLGWIVTYGSGETSSVQLSVASHGGSGEGSVVPDLSIEVDNLEDVYKRATESGVDIVYPLTEEPWGVRRFYARDPYGKIVNILQHID